MQARCARDPTLIVVSLDASAASDSISRQAMPEAAALLPFARLWLHRPSSFVRVATGPSFPKYPSSRMCRTNGPPQRALHLVRRFESRVADHTRLRFNVVKTALWNEAGRRLTACKISSLTVACQPPHEPSLRCVRLRPA